MTSAINRYESLGLAQTPQAAPATGKQNLGQADFLKLMTTQLQSQDPFKPMDSSQFLGQLAQFSTVTGIESLNSGFAALNDSLTGNQVLQGAALVGRQVQVPGDTLALGATNQPAASATLPASGALVATIRDAAGSVVRRIDLGVQAAGSVDIVWDGATASGTRAPPGSYTVSAELTAGDGRAQALATQVLTGVTAVSLGAQGLQLVVEGGRSLPLSAVGSIR